MRNANIESLLRTFIGCGKTDFLFSALNMPSMLHDWEAGTVTRAELAQAMNMALFEDLLERSSNGRTYTNDAIAGGGSVHFDHGALRTVRWPHNGALPPARVMLNAMFAASMFGQTKRFALPLSLEFGNRRLRTSSFLSSVST